MPHFLPERRLRQQLDNGISHGSLAFMLCQPSALVHQRTRLLRKVPIGDRSVANCYTGEKSVTWQSCPGGLVDLISGQ